MCTHARDYILTDVAAPMVASGVETLTFQDGVAKSFGYWQAWALTLAYADVRNTHAQ